MATLGYFLTDLAWPFHILIMAAFLGLVWLLSLPFGRLRPHRGQLLVTAGVLWAGVAFFVLTFSFRISPFVVVQASAVPRLWFYALVPVTALAIVPIVTGKADKDPKWGNVRLVSIVLAAIIVSLALFEIIGYYISSALFIVAVMLLLGSRKKIELAAVPVGWVLFSYLVFARLLGVRLPVGMIFAGLVG